MTGAFSSGDRVRCTFAEKTLEGTYITDRDGMAVVKLDSGYNMGVPFPACTLVEHLPLTPVKGAAVVQDPSLPPLSIVSTGGTIASRIDYRTGAVTSQFDADDILRAIPGLEKIANFRTRGSTHPLGEHDPADLAGTCPCGLR